MTSDPSSRRQSVGRSALAAAKVAALAGALVAGTGYGALASVSTRTLGVPPPSIPASFTAVHPADTLTWQSTAMKFEVEQSVDRSFSPSSVTTYTLRGAANQFTPYGLTSGQTYFFRVRAMSHSMYSRFTAPVSLTDSGLEQSVRLMTYNVLEARNDGRPEGGQHVAPWSQRKVVAAKLINSVRPDVVGVEEAASLVGPRHRRQIKSLVGALGGTYAMAHTELGPGQPGNQRTGDYILYNPVTYRTVGHGNNWLISAPQQRRHAAYQILENRATGAKFLFVDAHLLVGTSSNDNALREQETATMVELGNTYAAAHDVPVVYAGDFNAHGLSADQLGDGPAEVMLENHIADAYVTAQHRRNARYDSGNQYKRVPPEFRADIDHVFAPAGVAVRRWALVMDLHHGRFRGVMASDHNPVLATLDIPYQP